MTINTDINNLSNNCFDNVKINNTSSLLDNNNGVKINNTSSLLDNNSNMTINSSTSLFDSQNNATINTDTNDLSDNQIVLNKNNANNSSNNYADNMTINSSSNSLDNRNNMTVNADTNNLSNNCLNNATINSSSNSLDNQNNATINTDTNNLLDNYTDNMTINSSSSSLDNQNNMTINGFLNLSNNQIVLNENNTNDLPDKDIVLNKNDFERLQKFITVYYKALNLLNEDINIRAETLKLINNIPIYLDKDINIIKTIIKQLIDDKLSLDQFNKSYIQYILDQSNTTENILKLEYVFKNNNQYFKYFNISLDQVKNIPLRDNLELDINIIIKVLDQLINLNKDLNSFNIQYIKMFINNSVLDKYKKS